MAIWIMLLATAIGGRTHGKEQDKAQADAQIDSQVPGPLAIQVNGTEQPDLSPFRTNLRSCDQRIHRMVLLGTQACFQ
jgi:hypothetical protein